MNNTKTVVLKVKGLHTPRVLLWTKGVLDKLLHTGGLDPITGELTSSYITGQISRFESACEKCFAEADDKLKPVWVELDKLLVDYVQLSGVVSDKSTDDADNTTDARAREKAAKVKATNEAARVAIVKRLSELGNLVLAEVFQIDEAITATSKDMANAFTAYGHGLTWKPVYKNMLPTINTENYSADKLSNLHDVTWKTMISIVKEELKNDVV